MVELLYKKIDFVKHTVYNVSIKCKYKRYCMRKTSHPLYNIWISLLQRCKPEHAHKYPRYSGRGITICERWKDFYLFIEDMGERPSFYHSLDRIDNNGNYEPGNVRWSTRSQQAFNKGLLPSNKSGVKGVYWDKTRERWKATFGSRHLGSFLIKEEAIEARRRYHLHLTNYQ